MHNTLNERDIFYNMVNIEIADDPAVVLRQAQEYLDHHLNQVGKKHSKEYFDYSESALDDLLAKDEKKVQEDYSKYLENDPTPRPRDEMIMYIKQLTPAKYVDGAWLQGVAKANNMKIADNNHSEIITYLFNIYTEELGEGELRMNHVAIWKELLNSLQIPLPEPATHAFSHTTELWDSSFVVANIQLALGQFGQLYLPEILGYNMGFEQLPLHLLTTVDEMKKLGMDSYYFQLHISIDNSASGHAAAAAKSVKLYMDWMKTQHGKDIANEHWKRILNGFFMNNVNPMKQHYQDWVEKLRSSDDDLKALEIKMMALIRSKAPHANKLHGLCELGGKKLNDWMDPSASDDDVRSFLQVLGESHWMAESGNKFLEGVCGFGGPMFRIFTDDELKLIENWTSLLYQRTPAQARKAPLSPVPEPAPLDASKVMADMVTMLVSLSTFNLNSS